MAFAGPHKAGTHNPKVPGSSPGPATKSAFSGAFPFKNAVSVVGAGTGGLAGALIVNENTPQIRYPPATIPA